MTRRMYRFHLSFGMLLFQVALAKSLSNEDNRQSKSQVVTLKQSDKSTIRSLAIGDFDRINDFLKGTILSLPDADVDQNNLEFSIRNLQCSNIIIGDITTKWKLYNSTTAGVTPGFADTMGFEVLVSPFAIDCVADYTYKFGSLGFLDGSGKFAAKSSNSIAKTRLDLNSVNGFQTDFPSQADVEYCDATLNIDDINFEGNLLAEILSLAENFISNILEDQAKKIICKKLTDLGPNLFSGFFNETKTKVDKWMGKVPDDLSNPLFVEENEFVVPKNVTLVNFMPVDSNSTRNNNDSSISNFLVFGLKQASMLLGDIITDPNSPAGNESDLAINVLLRKSTLLNDDRVLTATLTNKENASGIFNQSLFETTEPIGFELLLNGFRLAGLDTITNFTSLVPIGKYTIDNKITWDTLAFDIDVTLKIKTAAPSVDSILLNPESKEFTENITVSIGFSNVTLSASLFLAIDAIKLEELQLGSLLYMENLLPCVLSVVHDIQISSLALSFENKTKLELQGYQTPGLEGIVDSVIEAAVVAFEPTVIKSLPNILQGPLRTILNEKLLPTIYDTSDCPKSNVTTNNGTVVDFRDLLLPEQDAIVLGGEGNSPYGKLVQSAYSLLSKEFENTDPDTGLAETINKYLSEFTKTKSGTSGSWRFNGDLLNQNSKIQAGGLDVSFQFRVYDAYIQNVDTMGDPLAILVPVKDSPVRLNNTATIGINRPVTIGLGLLIGLANDETQIMNDVDISISMDQLRFLATAYLKMSQTALFQFPLKDVGNLHCWLATISAPDMDAAGVRLPGSQESLRVTDFVGAVENLKVNVTCNECSGPEFSDLTELLSSDGNNEAVTNISNLVFNFLSNLVEGEFLKVAIDRALNDAPKKCPHNPLYEQTYTKSGYTTFEIVNPENSSSFFLILLIVCGTLISIVFAAHMLIKLNVRRRHEKWVNTLNQDQVVQLCKQQNVKNELEAEINATTSSMFSSKAIPFLIRIGMPFVMLGNIGLFLSGHLSLGASVTILVSLGGQTLRSDDFFSFSLAKTTIEIWNAGGKALAIIIFVSSFIWPYSKQIVTLGLWFAPTRAVSVSTRGTVLLWLDALAKWSMVDIFVLVVTIVCLKISIESPGVTFLPEELYQLNLLVVPKWGLYANMMAVLISHISSHYIIHYHRRIIETANTDQQHETIGQQQTFLSSSDDDEEESAATTSKAFGNISAGTAAAAARATIDTNETDTLFNYTFRGSWNQSSSTSGKLMSRTIVSPILIGMALCTTALIISGCVLPAFSVNVLGIIGILVESGQSFQEAQKSYSLFTVIQTLFEQAALTESIKDYIGLGSLSILAIVSVLIVPILQALTLLVQWFIALDKRRRRRISIALEILQAWQYGEVYLLSIAVASWQLAPISEFMINPYCEAIQDFLGQLVYYGIIKPEDAQCLKTDIVVEPTFYLLFTGTCVLAMLNRYVVKAVLQYFHEQEDDTKTANNDTVPSTNGDTKKALYLQDLDTLEGNSTNDSSPYTKESIEVPPIMFTDTFGWFLRHDETQLVFFNTR